MPVKMLDVLNMLEDVSPWSESAISKIDEDLSKEGFVRNMVCNKDINPTYRLAIPGIATVGDKENIIRLYKEAGWGDVIVTNSSEQDERPGMVGVTLKQYADKTS